MSKDEECTNATKSNLQTIQLGVIIEDSVDANKNSIMHRSHPMCHFHTFLTTKSELFTSLASDLAIEAIKKIAGRKSRLEMVLKITELRIADDGKR